MRTRRTAFLLAVFAVGVVVFLRFVAIRPPAKPAISVTILGYTKQGDLLCARVSLANLGRASVSYNEGGLAVGFDAFNTSRSKGRASVSYKLGGLAGPDGWLGAESSRGWTLREIGGSSYPEDCFNLARTPFSPLFCPLTRCGGRLGSGCGPPA